MAQKPTRKPRESKLSAAEKAIKDKLDTLEKQIGDKTPTDAQKETRKTLRAELAPLRFTRVAKQRLTRALKGISGLGALSGAGYESTAEQRGKIVSYLTDAVDNVKVRLEGVKAESAEIEL
jgi:hypothetical protein